MIPVKLFKSAIFLLLCVHAFAVKAEQATHTYDAQNRLIRTEYGDGAGIEYTYDAAGNRIGQQAISQTQPDLVVTAMTSAGSGVVGGKIKTYAIVKNQGDKDAGEFWIVFYLSKTTTFNPAEAIFLQWGCKIPSLAAGASFECNSDSTPVPDTLEPGAYYAVAHADVYQVIQESNETNNSLVASTATAITTGGGTPYPLKVTKPATGIVTSAPEGINCGGKNKACQASFSTVTLTATPNYGYGVKNWAGCPGSAGPTCTLTLTQAASIKANFIKLPRYTLKITKTRFGAITSIPAGLKCKATAKTCSAKFISGTEVTLTAMPLAGHGFGGWGGDSCSGIEVCRLTMDGNKTLSAAFD